MTTPARPLNRLPETLPAHEMKTWAVLAPLATHWRKATCAEIDCEPYLNGWGIAKKHLTDDDIRQLKARGYRFATVQIEEGQDHLWFEAGQQCFRSLVEPHLTQLDRPGLFIAREGDHRGNPRRTEATVFSGPDAWADSLNTNLEQFQE